MNSRRLIVTLAVVPLLFAGSLTRAGTAAGATSPALHLATARAHRVRSASDDPGLRSSSALVVDATHDSVLYARRANVATPIASITKLMTALVVLEAKQPLDETLEITAEDRNSGRGAFSRLAISTKLTRGELMHLALMSSENRAAHALGRNYPGGSPAFVLAMNAKARALGMTSARFVDAAGLSSQNVASAQDLSKLVLAVSQNPTIREFSTDRHYAVHVSRRLIEFHNTNSLVSNSTWNIIVQKTGYITEAGKCLVMQTVIDGRTVVIVLLNSVGRYTRTADARRIRKWMQAKLNERSSSMLASKA
jgi:serine-type D-Ala-D-Ala endopeptidase (penicillin-binding protein 7)